MPRLFDLEIGTGWLVVRVVGGALLSAAAFLILSYLPSHITEFASKYIPAEVSSVVVPIISSFVHPSLPALGAILAVFVFIEVLFRKTKVYGPTLILAGLVSVLYIYFAFHGGVITLSIPKGYTMGVQVNAYFDFTLIMVLAILPALLTVLKGIVITAKRES
ncbi:MAG: hypothetical protein N3D12_01125 [Candidatus Methanomethyliaceae archaeon]|nr:hypothetical protein [Candidatus Methanomethyliaceae archaeon]